MSHYLSTALGVAWRNLWKLIKTPALLLPPLLFPLFFFTAFAGGLSALGEAPNFGYPDYTAFQFVFVLLQASAFGGVFTGFAMAADFESEFTTRMLLAAPHRSAILLGYIISAFARTVAIMVMITVVALLAGMEVGGGPFDLAGVYALGLLINVAAMLFAAGIALRFRTLQATPLMQIPVFLILFLAPVYTPRELLTGWVGAAADYNPVTALLEAGRGLLQGDAVSVGLAFACAAGLIAVFVIWAVRGLRKAEAAG